MDPAYSPQQVDPRWRSRPIQPPGPGLPLQSPAVHQIRQQRPSDPRRAAEMPAQHFPMAFHSPPPPFGVMPHPQGGVMSTDQSQPIKMQQYNAPPPHFHPAWRPHPLMLPQPPPMMSHDQRPPHPSFVGAPPPQYVASPQMPRGFFSPPPHPPMQGGVVSNQQPPVVDAFVGEWLKRVGEERRGGMDQIRNQEFMKVRGYWERMTLYHTSILGLKAERYTVIIMIYCYLLLLLVQLGHPG